MCKTLVDEWTCCNAVVRKIIRKCHANAWPGCRRGEGHQSVRRHHYTPYLYDLYANQHTLFSQGQQFGKHTLSYVNPASFPASLTLALSL